MRAGVEPQTLVKQLKGIRCPSPGLNEGKQILSCSDAIASALEEEIDEEKITSNTVRKT